MRIVFRSGDLALEGIFTPPTEPCAHAAVICHPHPQYGGDMANPVVCAVATALQQEGYATLRLNFRGVGASDGTYDHGAGEADDARAAVRELIVRTGISPVALAGYSFGAMVALQAGADLAEVETLIGIAPPVAFFDLAFLTTCQKPKLFVVGDRDRFCSVAMLTQQLQNVAEPKVLRVLPGVDHFFAGAEAALAESVAAFARGGA